MRAPRRPCARRPLPTGPAPPARPCTILVAVADPATGALLHRALASAGHRVAVARALAAAARALATVRFDLVLAGALPGGPGGARDDRWAALERVRALAGGAPVVVATIQRPERFADWRARGFAALLTTPLDLADLLATVDEQLAPGRAGDARPLELGTRATPEGG